MNSLSKLSIALTALFTLAGCAGTGLGAMVGRNCKTDYSSNTGRDVYGNQTSPWSGTERMRTKCHYAGETQPGNLNAPGHLQHMDGKGNDNFKLVK